MKFIELFTKNLLILISLLFCLFNLKTFCYSISNSILLEKTDDKLTFNTLKEKKKFKSKHKMKIKYNKNSAMSQNKYQGIGK